MAGAHKRDLPDYDGRAAPEPPGRAWLWLPRVVLSPAYVVDRYVLYPPIRAVSIWAEKNRVPVRVVGALTVENDDVKAQIFPTALFDFGFRPSVGLLMSTRTLGQVRLDTQLRAATGGRGWGAVRASSKWQWTDDAFDVVTGSLLWVKRPDRLYYGTPNDERQDASRFSREQLEARLGVHVGSGVGFHGGVSARVSRDRFGPGDSPSIETVYTTDDLPGFGGTTWWEGRLPLSYDSRVASPGNGSGVRLDVNPGVGRSELAPRWLALFDGATGIYVDMTGDDDTLSLSQHVSWVQGGTEGGIPFAEWPTLGGLEHLRGFLHGRFRGGTALNTTLQYTTPVWAYADGTWFVDVGGVFDEGFSRVSSGDMRASFGTGFRSVGRRDTAFQMLVAVGTGRFQDPFAIDNVRIVLGNTGGF